MCVVRLMTADQADQALMAAAEQQEGDSGNSGSRRGNSGGRIMPSLTGTSGSVQVMGPSDVLEPG